jgi:hypothetical protein
MDGFGTETAGIFFHAELKNLIPGPDRAAGSKFCKLSPRTYSCKDGCRGLKTVFTSYTIQSLSLDGG